MRALRKRLGLSSFHGSIRRAGGMTKRKTVLELMRVAGYENDARAFTRLLVENPISRQAANEAWSRGVTQRGHA